MPGLIPLGDGTFIDPLTGMVVGAGAVPSTPPAASASPPAAPASGPSNDLPWFASHQINPNMMTPAQAQMLQMSNPPSVIPDLGPPKAPPNTAGTAGGQTPPVAAGSAPLGVPPSPAPSALPGAAPNDPMFGPPAPTTPPQVSPTAAANNAPDAPKLPSTGGRYAPILSALYAGESGGGANAGQNPNSTASGGFQLLDGTWNDFVNSPANVKPGGGQWAAGDKNDPGAQQQAAVWNLQRNDRAISSALGSPATDNELLAAHLIGPTGVTALMQNPDKTAGSLLPPDVLKNNPGVIPADAAGPQAVDAIANWYRTKGAGVPGGSVSGGPQQPQAPQGLPGWGPQDIQTLLAQIHGDVPPVNSGNEYLALASGLLGAPTLGMGMGRGLQGLLQQRQQERATGAQLAHLDTQLASMGIMSGFRTAQAIKDLAQAGAIPTQLRQGQQTADARTLRAQTGAEAFGARLSGSLAQGQKEGTEAGDDVQALLGTRQQDAQTLSDASALRQEIAQHPELLGSTIKNHMTRLLTSAGIIGDANDLSALQKGSATFQNNYMQHLTNGHVGGIRSYQEAKMLSGAMSQMDTNPRAALWIIQQQENAANARNAWRDAYASMLKSDPNSVTGRNYHATYDNFMKDWLQQNPLPEFVPSGATGVAPAQAGPPPLSSFWSR